jgi:hypothetical protein
MFAWGLEQDDGRFLVAGILPDENEARAAAGGCAVRRLEATFRGHSFVVASVARPAGFDPLHYLVAPEGLVLDARDVLRRRRNGREATMRIACQKNQARPVGDIRVSVVVELAEVDALGWATGRGLPFSPFRVAGIELGEAIRVCGSQVLRRPVLTLAPASSASNLAPVTEASVLGDVLGMLELVEDEGLTHVRRIPR